MKEQISESIVILAANETYSGDWVQLAPFGQWPNKVGLQHFYRDEAQSVVNEFQSLLSTPTRLLGLPWYIGHPDYEPLKERYRDTRAYGRVKELQVRDSGLYGRVKFSAEGKKMIADEAFHGHSVNWAMKRDAQGQWHPFRLKSVGWTNEPQIPVAPVTAANEQQTTMDRTKIIKLLGLADGATDEEAFGKLQALCSAASSAAANETQLTTVRTELTLEKSKATTLATQLAAANTTTTAAQTEATNERQRARDLLIEKGVREGKILVAEQDAWKGKFEKNFTEAVNELQAAKPKLNTQSKVVGLGRRNANLGSDRGHQIADAVNERRAKFPHEGYDSSFAAVKREKPELFAVQTS